MHVMSVSRVRKYINTYVSMQTTVRKFLNKQQDCRQIITRVLYDYHEVHIVVDCHDYCFYFLRFRRYNFKLQCRYVPIFMYTKYVI